MSDPVTAELGGHSAAHHELLWLVALVVFVLAIAGLFWVYRRSKVRVELEEVDAILQEHEWERQAEAQEAQEHLR